MKRKGFTLIELLAVIVILAIIALIATPMIMDVIEKARKSAAIDSVNGLLESAEQYQYESMLDGIEPTKTIDLTSDILKHKGAKPDSGTLIIGENGKMSILAKYGKYCIEKTYNDESPKVVEDSVCESGIQVVYQDAILNGADPVLKDALIPVIIENDGVVKRADIHAEWYNYSNRKWANAVILKDSSVIYADNEIIPEENIKQYYVWIPRYRYQLWNVDGEVKYPNGTERESAINIVFEDRTTSVSSGTQNGEWLTHPAFTSFDTAGLWVGKFETSYDEESYTNPSTFNTTNPNVANATNGSNIIIKPNVRSLTYKSISEYYTMSRDVSRNLNSHMMKNSEWGAVAYLTYSLYGKCTETGCEEVYINNIITGYYPSSSATFEGQWQYGATITGCSGESASAGALGNQNACASGYAWNEGNNKASTTGNISGIYDMSGGNWEYVMGVIKDQNGNPMSGRNALYNSGFNGTYGYPTSAGQSTLERTDGIPFPTDTRYYDLYNANSTELGDDTWYQYQNGHLGDGTKEIAVSKEDASSGDSGIWFNDHVGFSTASYPWISRGGAFHYGTIAGIFTFNHLEGPAYGHHSSRVVLTY